MLCFSLYPSTFKYEFLRSAKTYSFCFSKEERSRTFITMVYHLIFLFQSCRLLNSILSFQKFASITESSILYFLVSFGVSFWIFCPLSGGAVYYIEFLSTMFRNLSIVSLFWGSLYVLRFILSYCHSIRWKLEKCENITLF